MNKLLGVFLSVSLMIAMLPVTAYAKGNIPEQQNANVVLTEGNHRKKDQIINIPDDGFRALLNKKLFGKEQPRDPKAPITQTEMASIKRLSLNHVSQEAELNVKSIEGIQHAVNLEELYMPYCYLEDSDTVMFKPLKNLKALVLNFSHLTNTAFCDELPADLETLGLHENKIQKMDNLVRLKKMSTLGIGYNNVTDLSFINQMTGVTR